MTGTDRTMRPLETADFARLAVLQNAVNSAAGWHMVTSGEELEDEISAPYVSLPADGRCIEADGVLVGYVHTYMVDSTERELRCHVFGGVHPDHRRRGHGTALLGWGVARALEQLGSNPLGLPTAVRVESMAGDSATEALLASHGFVPVRWFNDLRLALTAAPHLAPPAGVTVAPWDPGRGEELRTVKNDAFRDHWGSTPTSIEGWAQMTGGFGARPDLSFMALEGDRIVGLLLSHRYPDDDAVIGGRYGWVDKIATLRSHRGRGIATALLGAAIGAYAREGLTHAALNVDTGNPTGAFGLYTRLGFEPFRGAVTHELTRAG